MSGLCFHSAKSISRRTASDLLSADTRAGKARATSGARWLPIGASLRYEALALLESDLDRSRGAVLVRRGKGGERREVGMDRWAWDQLDPWLEVRRELPIGALLCVIHGPTAGRRWEASAARKQLHHAAAAAGVRRRFAPHQLRHAHPVEMAHEASRSW